MEFDCQGAPSEVHLLIAVSAPESIRLYCCKFQEYPTRPLFNTQSPAALILEKVVGCLLAKMIGKASESGFESLKWSNFKLFLPNAEPLVNQPASRHLSSICRSLI